MVVKKLTDIYIVISLHVINLKWSIVLEKEIKQWHKGFLEEYPNGRITEEGFIKIYMQFFPSSDPSKFASQVFRMFDENKVRYQMII